MMTCRLLCALLVLALCCCPSVGAAENKKESREKTEVDTKGKGSKMLSTTPKTKPATKAEEDDGGGPGTTAPGPISGDAAVTLQAEGSDDKKRLQSSTNTFAGKEDQEAKDPAATTTTTSTTMAPTTTTTTAPEAPSTTTTTTETPTTTTTRAPSLLREIDGSLSSSAWVCAPLLLAASALACTAVG
ncbi:putative mucin TcMUCII [Trypanosoma cruzi]|uniref:Mucin TcMUCII, putative n=2 Tax=Trypanosoma cruzi TaxID=5693 RepID=Q4DR13_TRYCC|nr:mucin TcMUCII, putative [Trypanosoma cruzi]EAN94975.1 mucin TcMUCII, putative [Trypanosoma cruzi]PWV19894.1 putative mucin TcMUCII [Trypanosoma cruzi]RNC51474.1 mucin TcMUCII [Trypanosoma cruzi]|eukprot:XP_816826.1 mucin TcMUCII [Trypanosoma cruzi strain CL Brener]